MSITIKTVGPEVIRSHLRENLTTFFKFEVLYIQFVTLEKSEDMFLIL